MRSWLWTGCLVFLLAVVGCSSPQIAPPPVVPVDPQAGEEVTLTKEHLAAKLGIPVQEIELLFKEAVSWPDTSLGVPEPGKFYAQVVVPGFRVILSAEGKEYAYHTGELEGKTTVIADPGAVEGGWRPPPP
ncbi:MAG: hypothetical protein Q7K03_02130 [Dehalococcoidia bacterium]|nr:hypothetical protein [Dehalococcoidia bacterium]